MTKPVMREQERAQRAMARPVQAMQNNYIGGQEESIDSFVADPQQVIKQSRKQKSLSRSPP